MRSWEEMVEKMLGEKEEWLKKIRVLQILCNGNSEILKMTLLYG